MNQVHTGVDIAARRVARSIAVFVLLALNVSSPGFAQDAPAAADEAIDTRTQYPVLLRNSYFSINLGYLDYDFTAQQLDSQDLELVYGARVRVASETTPDRGRLELVFLDANGQTIKDTILQAQEQVDVSVHQWTSRLHQ